MEVPQRQVHREFNLLLRHKRHSGVMRNNKRKRDVGGIVLPLAFSLLPIFMSPVNTVPTESSNYKISLYVW